MDFSLTPCLQGVAIYLLCCGLLILAGRGLLRLARCQVQGAIEPALAAVVAVLFWCLFNAIVGTLPVRLKLLAPVGWAATLVLAVLGVRKPWPAWREVLPVLLACIVIPAGTMPRSFSRGLLDETTTLPCDGFNYMAYGKWLWDIGRGGDAGPTPVHQIGHATSNTRHVSAALLGFLSVPVRAGDTSATAALLLALALFAAANGVLLFWLTRDCGRLVALIATAFIINGGWIANILWSNNYDHALALMYMPAMAGVLSLKELGAWRRWGLFGALLAGSVYTYLESTPFLVTGAVLLVLPNLLTEGRLPRLAWGFGRAALAACLLLVPYVGPTWKFARNQWQAIQLHGSARPGANLFREMLLRRNEPSALWGLGGECWGKPWHFNLFAWGLTLLFVLGVAVLLGRRVWGWLLAVSMFLAAFAYFLLVQDYAYGAYKVLSLGWWCLAGVVVYGAVWLVRQLPRRARLVVGGGLACAGLALGLGNLRPTVPLVSTYYPALLERDFRRVQAIRPLLGNDPVLVATGDWATCYLATFYLSDTHVILLAPQGIYAWWFRPLFDPPSLPAAQRYYVLTDKFSGLAASCAARGELAWDGEPYRLWRISPGGERTSLVFLRDQTGWCVPTGAESVRIEANESLLLVRAARDGSCRLSATLSAASGGPTERGWPLQIKTATGHEQLLWVPDGRWQATVPVRAGMNWISLRTPQEPATGAPAPGYVLTGLRVE